MTFRCVVRVLVVDNDQKARSQVVKMLEGSGYKVWAADGQGVELQESAKLLARMHRPHVVIMDLRLIDEHADDRSGLELWKDDSFSSSRCILYSSHLVHEVTRKAFQQRGVKDVLRKQGSPQELVDTVEQIAREGCGCMKKLSLVWPQAWNEETVIQYLFRDADDIPCDLVLDLFGRMFPDTEQVVLKPLDGTVKSSVPATRGRSVVFQIWPDDREPQVLKLAPHERIEREVNAYTEHIKDRLVGLFYAELQRYASFWDLGGICYSFIGTSQKSIESFASFYSRTKSSSEIIKPLEHFFGEVWHRRYLDSRPLTGTLFDAYDPKRKLYGRLRVFPFQEKTLAFPWFSGTFLNPATWLLTHAKDSYSPYAQQAVVHGDLHGDNLFVDKEHAWAIDFERSGMSHILRDFVELEQNIITRLIVLPENDWNLFHSFAVLLAKPISPDQMITLPQDFERNEDIKKAVEVINGLRAIAQRATRYRDMHEYYWGLLMDTAFSLTLAPFHSLRWWRALLLSSVLCRRLRDWDSEWPPADWQRIDRPSLSLSNLENATGRSETAGSVTTTTIFVGGNVDGNLTVGDGNQSIKDSFNKMAGAKIDPELRETLKMLAAAVEVMNKSLSREQAADVTNDFTKLLDEATKTAPSQRWYSVSIDGLTRAAENVGKVGEPVLNLSRKVLVLLTAGMIK